MNVREDIAGCYARCLHNIVPNRYTYRDVYTLATDGVVVLPLTVEHPESPSGFEPNLGQTLC
jgi:hypothetical protein